MRSILALLLAGAVLLVACDDDANKRPRKRRGAKTPAVDKATEAQKSTDDGGESTAKVAPAPAPRVAPAPAPAPTPAASVRPSYTQFKKVSARKTEEIEAALRDGWTLVNCGGGIWGSAAGAQAGKGGGGYERCYFVK